MKPVAPWSLRTGVRYPYDAHQRYRSPEREVRALRALVEGREPAARTPPGPAPDAPHRDHTA